MGNGETVEQAIQEALANGFRDITYDVYSKSAFRPEGPFKYYLSDTKEPGHVITITGGIRRKIYDPEAASINSHIYRKHRSRR